MKPGPELDALIAEKVMGWGTGPSGKMWISRPVRPLQINWQDLYVGFMQHGATCGVIFSPSTKIEHAWLVVEKLQKDNWYFQIMRMPQSKPGYWHAEFGGVKGYADTAPLAICLAALETAK